MEIKEVIFYVISRLNFHRIDYEVYNAKTGSTYIRVGKDRIRISDHPGEHDDYNYIIRTDCNNPVQLPGKCAVSADNTDNIINPLIKKYKENRQKKITFLQAVGTGKLDSEIIKNVDMDILWKIIKYNKKNGNPPSRKECYKKLIENKQLWYDYIEKTRKELGE